MAGNIIVFQEENDERILLISGNVKVNREELSMQKRLKRSFVGPAYRPGERIDSFNGQDHCISYRH